MKLALGIISLILGLYSFIVLAELSWEFHSTIFKMIAAGEGDISPRVVSGLFPIAIPVGMILIGIFCGLFKIKRRSKTEKRLSIAGIVFSIAAILVVVVPFFFW